MSFYESWILPRVLDLVMRQKQMTPFRERVGAAAEGRVLDMGIGSGLNLPFYGPRTHQVIGVDPSEALLRFAEGRARKMPAAIELLKGSGEALPLDDRSVDTVVMTFTLCTIPDAAKAVAEIRRVLKPGGSLLFAEHGRAPDPGVARWQDRITPLWKRISGGCHLNRQPDVLIRATGLRIEALEAGYIKGPRAMTYVYEGRARVI
ncbi:class I SAM-dependent methyltransferase [Vineibacter terrae]|uniref:Class I SAM-dependent methyltransferase n=1 Tax=Vineibacter terrae TaxID=2586908 RepID=A0A5C8PTU8_9HYPH|nr:class I SAM-dependent methyltransferase [Vineibacter terrae]TXL80509.1 class I SAM-dependent methyltransferase [Vineibacter terrae]